MKVIEFVGFHNQATHLTDTQNLVWIIEFGFQRCGGSPCDQKGEECPAERDEYGPKQMLNEPDLNKLPTSDVQI